MKTYKLSNLIDYYMTFFFKYIFFLNGVNTRKIPNHMLNIV